MGHFSSQVTQQRLSQTHLPWPKCNKYTIRAQPRGYDQKSKHFFKSSILKLFQEKQGFRNQPGFSLFLFLMHHCLVSKLVSKETVIPTLPSLPCPASIPVLFHPSYGSKAMPKERQSRVKILQCHREIVHSSLCARVSQHGVAVMSLMVILHFWFMLQEHTARLTPGVGEMILMFSVSCFQKSPLLHV